MPFRVQLSLGDVRVVRVKMFINHSGSPAPFPVLSGAAFLNTWRPRLCHTLDHRAQDRQASALVLLFVSVRRTGKTQAHKCMPNSEVTRRAYSGENGLERLPSLQEQ